MNGLGLLKIIVRSPQGILTASGCTSEGSFLISYTQLPYDLVVLNIRHNLDHMLNY